MNQSQGGKQKFLGVEIMKEIRYSPIGIIHSPFKKPEGTPIQPIGGKGISGTIEIFPQYVEGLKDLEGFSHLVLIYHFHLCRKSLLKVKPFMDNQPRGVFSTRAPSRPNPIGLSVVRLVKIEGSVLHVEDLDVVEGTPLLDIKPYVSQFDLREVDKIGWLEKNIHRLFSSRDDGRFIK